MVVVDDVNLRRLLIGEIEHRAGAQKPHMPAEFDEGKSGAVIADDI
ncbi:hypothetical protein [Polymorphobacter megasporae]|nr:hypothetical protein [Polymorphobacter megasporae]UAJ10500.1 hypothetical protein KTC28_01675 [Polymorphobacter megasporae]